MQDVLFDSDYSLVMLDTEYSILTIIWKDECNSEQYQKIFNMVLEKQKTTPIVNYLSDIRKIAASFFENLNWFETYVIPTAISQGLKRGASVVCDEVSASEYIKTMQKISTKNKIDYKLFQNTEEAIYWLISFDDYSPKEQDNNETKFTKILKLFTW